MSRLDISLSDSWFIGEDQDFLYHLVDDQRPPVAIDLTGYSIVFELSDTYSGDPLFTPIAVSTGSDPTRGIALWTVPSLRTINLTGDTEYWYTLRRIDTGERQELAWGSARLLDVYVNY